MLKNENKKGGSNDKTNVKQVANRLKEAELNNKQLQEFAASLKAEKKTLMEKSDSSTKIIGSMNQQLRELQKKNLEQQDMIKQLEDKNSAPGGKDEKSAVKEMEKTMKQEQNKLKKELENSHKTVALFKEKITKSQKQLTDQEAKIRDLELENQISQTKSSQSNDYLEKFGEYDKINKVRLAEISQLKLIIDRITKENKMFSNQIKEAKEKQKGEAPELKQAKESIEKLEQSLSVLQKGNESSSQKMKTKEKSLMDALARKEIECAKAQKEIAKLQVDRNKDKMALASVMSINQSNAADRNKMLINSDQKIKDLQSVISKLTKENTDHRLQIQILEGFNRHLTKNKLNNEKAKQESENLAKTVQSPTPAKPKSEIAPKPKIEAIAKPKIETVLKPKPENSSKAGYLTKNNNE
jgi:hypothetical protein